MTRIGVVGASARAAVHSLARAGFSAWAIDLFADRDLAHVADCAVCPSDQYPDAIPALAARFPPGPVLYTGGLENHPQILRDLSRTRELWGNPPDVVERVRDPFTLFPLLANAGFATPRLVPRAEPCPAEGRWLRKPYRSAGGLGIRIAHPGEAPSLYHYFQELLDGAPMSALFVNATLFGITEQLIGEPWLHAKPFAYCGNSGPLEPPTRVTLLAKLFREMGLRGAWGIDFVLGRSGPVVLEVNPRCTAGAEVLEHGNRRTVFGADPPPRPPSLQGRGKATRPTPPAPPSLKGGGEGRTEGGEAPAFSVTSSPPPFRGGVGSSFSSLPEGRGAGGVDSLVGKAIYYAPHTFTFPASGPWDADLAGDFDPWRLPGFADIPAAGSRIEAGSPVLTFFATGSTPLEVRVRLQSGAGELDRLVSESQS